MSLANNGVVRGLIPAHAGKTHQATCPVPDTRAHPRSRGENYEAHALAIQTGGSSPLTQGKRHRRWGGSHRWGLIPTHAGKPSSGSRRASGGRAHPRSCGENDGGFKWQADFPGSSPLMWGKPWLGPLGRDNEGLIPTHAGKTKQATQRPRDTRAHPHSCGENRPMIAMCAVLLGSSPLMRGKQRAGEGRAALGGLIPTHAGKTTFSRSTLTRAWAHPRSREENVVVAFTRFFLLGSSPLMRGKRPERVDELPEPGLIPAHAGKTSLNRAARSRSGAHPRSRAENPATCGSCVAVAGSSPLTQGKHEHAGRNLRRRGIIPAHAGKTLISGSSRPRAWVHPRSLEENMGTVFGGVAGAGSSPPTRGKRNAEHLP